MASVDVMYMVTMTTHMSMQFKSVWIAEAMGSEDVEFSAVACRRGMLSGPSAANSGGVRVPQGVGRGGDQFAGRGMRDGLAGGGIVDGAGTSGSRGAVRGRMREGGSSSEED